jgi:hypothetical protein
MYDVLILFLFNKKKEKGYTSKEEKIGEIE